MSWWRTLREMPADAPARTVLVAATVALACAVVVSTTAVLLRPRQMAARRADQQQRITGIVAGLPAATRQLIEATGEAQVEARVVELATGDFVDTIDPLAFDQRRAAADPARSVAIPPDDDLARLGRRALYATVFLVRSHRGIELIVLPVHGQGYASTLYGYLALAGDGNTVVALTFFEHGETPGFGAGITDRAWQQQWVGRKVRDEAGAMRLGVARGTPASRDAAYQVDGLTGATTTGRGVTALLRFWLGPWGFGPFLDRVTAR